MSKVLKGILSAKMASSLTSCSNRKKVNDLVWQYLLRVELVLVGRCKMRPLEVFVADLLS